MAAMYEMTLDPIALFYADDPDLELWLDMVVERVHETHEEQARKNS